MLFRSVIGTGGTPAQIAIAVDPGQKASVQRAWTNSFLYYVNQGYYNGTIFHSLFQSAVVDGGCYSSTSLNKKQFLPSFALDAVAFSGPPNPAQNLQYTLSMNPDACTGNQYSSFALYVVKNNNRDTSKYVVIGNFSDQDAAVVNVLSNLERRGGPWLSESPSDKDLPKGTIKSLTQIR